MTVPTRIAISKVYNFTNTSGYKKYKNFFFILLVICIFIALSVPFTNFASDVSKRFERIDFKNLKNLPEVKLSADYSETVSRNPSCTHWDCFNIYRCGHNGHDRIAVYVYPLVKYLDHDGVPATEPISKEFFSLLNAVIKSKYYTANPDEACIFIPSIDTLNQERIRHNVTSKVLKILP